MSDAATSYRVPAGLIGALGALWSGIPSAVSPLRAGGRQAAGETEFAALVAAGVCDAAGRPAPGIAPALDVLGPANAFVRVYLSGGASVEEFVVYRAPNGATASVVNTAGDLDVQSPAPTDVFAAVTAQLIGDSAFRSVAFDTTLSGDEAVVFAAVIDLQRKASLAAIADERDAGAAELDSSAVAAACGTRTGHNQWLANVLLDLAESAGLPPDRVPGTLATLAAKGLVAGGPRSYRLAGDALSLAGRLLLIDAALTLTAGFAGVDGQVSVVGFTCLQTGVHDILYIEVSDDGVEMRAESAAAILEMVGAFMDDPAVLQGLGGTVSPAASVPARSRFCMRCGAPAGQEDRFCLKCGAPLE